MATILISHIRCNDTNPKIPKGRRVKVYNPSLKQYHITGKQTFKIITIMDNNKTSNLYNMNLYGV